MPLGWERINAKTSAPNKNIVFIKPRPGPDEKTSKDFLERIAAQCVPIMNKNHLAVVSLEEYEPNLEFWGRNFNNGEIIQLVLKSPSTGRWLPFRFVQMVMMHELAHCKQMNHSKAFWVVRNALSAEVRILWDKGYTGDGLWGRGVLLDNGAFAREELDAGESLPEHLCGGTFRSKRGKKRGVKPKITHKERQERRVKKKFGVSGITLGADEETKIKLEKGKTPTGKPKVAGSKRGRELRAAAALARFETKEPEIKDEDLVTDSETEIDDDFVIKQEPDDAIDINGLRLVDTRGRGMVKVCEDEDNDDDEVKHELLEIHNVQRPLGQRGSAKGASKVSTTSATAALKISTFSSSQASLSKKPLDQHPPTSSTSILMTSKVGVPRLAASSSTATSSETERPSTEEPLPEAVCGVCSFRNDTLTLTCMICANVLKPDCVVGTWRCPSSTCKNSAFINVGDNGVCGVCGTRKNS